MEQNPPACRTIGRLRRFWREQAGQDLIEYSLLLAVIALAIVTLINGASGSMRGLFTQTCSALSSANTAAS